MGTIDVDITHTLKYRVGVDGVIEIENDKWVYDDTEVLRLVREDMEEMEP